MRLVNHASNLVHQIYLRERVDDVVKWMLLAFHISRTN